MDMKTSETGYEHTVGFHHLDLCSAHGNGWVKLQSRISKCSKCSSVTSITFNSSSHQSSNASNQNKRGGGFVIQEYNHFIGRSRTQAAYERRYEPKHNHPFISQLSFTVMLLVHMFLVKDEALPPKNNKMFFSVQSNHHLLIITHHHPATAAEAVVLTALCCVSNTVQAQLWASVAELRYWLGSSDCRIINHCLGYCFSTPKCGIWDCATCQSGATHLTRQMDFIDLIKKSNNSIPHFFIAG